MSADHQPGVLVKAKLRVTTSDGLGFTVTQRPSGTPPTLMVKGLTVGSEAEKCGLVRPGDIVLHVDEADLSKCTFEEGQKVLWSLRPDSSVRLLLRAPFGYTTRLETTFLADGSPRTFRITERLYSSSKSRDKAADSNGSNSGHFHGSPNGPLVGLNLKENCDYAMPETTETHKGKCPARRAEKLKNVSSAAVTVDTFHQVDLENIGCTGKVCKGSLMNWKHQSGLNLKRTPRSQAEVINYARNFFDQYYASIKRLNSDSHEQRWAAIVGQVQSTGSYQLTETELIFGAKLAWRNAARCIGRIQWSKLQVFDFRFISTPREMFEAICNHIKYATNKGNLRSAITIFPQREGDGKNDYRVWNSQLVAYAGYSDNEEPNRIIGDPSNLEFTQASLCEKLGWKGNRTRWDILPLLLSAEGQDPVMFTIPDDLVLRVQLKHPKFDWWDQLGLEWYALPAVSSMLLDVGGIEYPAAPFSGWYMVTEIACRDLCDVHRYNILEEVANRMGLDTRSNTTLWKDAALVEVHISVIDSFQKAGVTIVDHHTAAESFMKHLENEQRLRGGCPADWVWVVPPTAGGLTPVFHQEMLNYEMKPSYEYQEAAWKTHDWKKAPGSNEEVTPIRKIKFKEIARAVKFTSNLFGKALSKRIKATILYATETGKSEHYAKRLSHIFSHAFNVNVVCMDSYDTFHLEHEALLLIVTSTFGNGDPPENGESFARQLQAIKMTGDTTPDIESVRSISMSYLRIASMDSLSEPAQNLPTMYEDSVSQVGPLSNIRFAVFGLGSSAYPNFCSFGRFIDTMLADLGGERICRVATGDELCGQEQAFNDWSRRVFEDACNVFCLGDEINLSEVMKSATLKPVAFSADNVRLVPAEASNLDSHLLKGLTKGSNRRLVQLSVLAVTSLYSELIEDSNTVKVELEATNEETDSTASGFTYLPGDHLGVFPENDSRLIDGLVSRLPDLNFDKHYMIMMRSIKQVGLKEVEEWLEHDRLPVTSLRYALTRYLDITTPPTQQLLNLFRTFADDEADKQQLKNLSVDSRKYEEWKALNFPNLLDVLNIFSSLQPSAEFLLTQLSPMQPRFYSISSSPAYNALAGLGSRMLDSPLRKVPPSKMAKCRPEAQTLATVSQSFDSSPRSQPGTPTMSNLSTSTQGCTRVDLTVSVVQYRTQKNVRHYGVCSNFLANAKPGKKLYGFIRNAPNFRLPDDEEVPVIMVGPGTGIAPFRAFWLHRFAAIVAENKRQSGPMTLFSGCRMPAMQLYRDELLRMIQDGALNHSYVAFSREPHRPKVYVQDRMMEASKHIFHQLVNNNGHFYVCGDVSMAQDVCKTLKTILKQNGVEDPDTAMLQLKESMRYHEDIFGITLRTAEVTRKGRTEALRKTDSMSSLN
ncbi:Nitric oxide synthase [Halotydeus destructor]|nr:Nitric oxide synthase [Halotydeus destructor]